MSYDATVINKRRKQKALLLASEEASLRAGDRRKLVSTARDLPRNFAVAAWAIRRHLDYVATFSFQSKTGDDVLDDAIEAHIRERSKPGNFEITGRHSRDGAMRLLEAARTLDGDHFPMLLDDGRLQFIEGDRVRDPEGQGASAVLGDMAQGVRCVQGVYVTEAGQPIGYAVHRRGRDGIGFEFEAVKPAGPTYQHAYWSRFDQVRGVSPLASAINTLLDTYENIDYALAKAKVSQLFALAVYSENANVVERYLDQQARDAADEADAVGEAAASSGETPTSPTEPKYQVNFGGGPLMMEMEPGDRGEILESQTPSTQFQSFMEVTIAISLKSLDIPYSFYDEAHTNFAGGRTGLLVYMEACKPKQDDNRNFLDWWTRAQITLGVLVGAIPLPKGFDPARLQWAWRTKSIPWPMDPQTESLAASNDVSWGLNSRQRYLAERGRDYYEVVDELADEQAYAAKKGVTITETATATALGSVQSKNDTPPKRKQEQP